MFKAYLPFFVDTTENLEIQHIFSICDETVYSKLLHKIWNHRDKFKKIIPFMGGISLATMPTESNAQASCVSWIGNMDYWCRNNRIFLSSRTGCLWSS